MPVLSHHPLQQVMKHRLSAGLAMIQPGYTKIYHGKL